MFVVNVKHLLAPGISSQLYLPSINIDKNMPKQLSEVHEYHLPKGPHMNIQSARHYNGSQRNITAILRQQEQS